jgi:hypothetical protein
VHNKAYNSLQPLFLPADGVGECRGTHRQNKKPNSLPLGKDALLALLGLQVREPSGFGRHPTPTGGDISVAKEEAW